MNDPSFGMKVAGEPTTQPSTGQYFGGLLSRVLPPVVVAGPDLTSPDGKIRFARAGEDAELLEKTEHVRKPKETLMEFYSRTGCGAAQVRSSSKAEIAHFVETVSRNEKDVLLETRIFEPRQAPQRFFIVG